MNSNRDSILSGRFIFLVGLCGMTLFLLLSCADSSIQPPIAKKTPKIDTIFGDILTDNYFWMRDRENQEVLDYLTAENGYTQKVMKHTEKLQEQLFQELKSRVRENDETAPFKKGDYFYYSRTEANKQYNIYCRKKGSLDAEEEIYLDVNILAEPHEFLSIGAMRVSPDGKILAYSTDTTGREIYTIYFKDLKTGKLFDDVIDNGTSPFVWAANSKTLFYPTLDHINRADKLFKHTLGQSAQNDPLVFHEPDEAFDIYVSKTRDKKYILLSLVSNNSSEVHYMRSDRPNDKFKMIAERQDEVEYQVNHRVNSFYITTNENALNFKVLQAPVLNSDKSSWRELIAHRDSVYIESVEIFRNFMVILEREDGLRRIRIDNFKTKKSHYIEMADPIYHVWTNNNVEFDTDLLRFTYQSLVQPKTIFDYNMASRKKTEIKFYDVPGGYNPNDYKSERLYATAADGMEIPISLVYKKGIKLDGTNPLLLYGYGSYGATMSPTFSTRRIGLLDRGFVYAIAHVRGSSTRGRWWYDQGRLLNKRNSFTDFNSCAEYLIAQKYSSPEKLIAQGGSAGGLLMGGIANMRPDLYHGIIAAVPFVDVINTMRDSTIPLTVTEFTEWGNPADEQFYHYMKSYSPYDNVEAKDYPNMLITAGLYDNRVQYWEPAKWTAKLRAMKTDNNRLLLKVNMSAGHGGASGRYDYLREYAFRQAFMLDILGIAE